jgi:hypothetical protein
VLARTTYEPTEPPGDAVFGGVPVGEDLGYGPLRMRNAHEVSRTAAALSELDLNVLRLETNMGDLVAAEIYPGGWDVEDGARDWIVDAVAAVRDLYVRSASAGHAMLLFIV